MVTVTLLGTAATMPLPDRALTTALLAWEGHSLLFDCGEGTQAAARRWGCSLYKLDAILLTHYHGDHIFGLPGLLQTQGALGRTAPVTVAGPPGLRALLELVLQLTGPLPFPLHPVELADCRGRFPVPGGEVEAFPCRHRVACCGYAFTLPRAGRFDPQRARAAGIPLPCWRTLQAGQPVDGFTPEMVLGPPRRGIRVVYATDTAPCPALRRAAAGADLLVMDATYADDADAPKARQYGHATCRQAGALAAAAGVRRLWLTHYSAAVTDPGPGLAAAAAAFPGAEAGADGKRATLRFEE